MNAGNTTYRSNFRVIIMFLAFFIVGIALLPLLNVRLNPSRTLPSIVVNYSWPNASARVCEQHVTSKLEGIFGGMEGLKNIRSVSRKGGGRISMDFIKGTDMDMARFMVSTLVKRAYKEFPNEVSYPNIRVNTGGDNKKTLMTLTVSGPDLPIELQQYANEEPARQLATIKGIENINVYGGTPMEYRITFNLQLLKKTGLDISAVKQCVQNAFNNQALGAMEQTGKKGNGRVLNVLLSNTNNRPDIWHIPITTLKGRVIFLTDIATIEKVEQLPQSYYRINGKNTVNMVVTSNTSANELKLGREIRNMLAELEKTLPAGYHIQISYDSTEYIAKEVRKTFMRSLLSLLFLMVFVFVVSRNLKYLLLLGISLLANLILAVCLYYLFNIEIHLYSLAGITVSFGIIIDNSIVMFDHYRLHGNKKVFIAILAATLTTIGSLAVIFFLKESQQINLADFAWVMMANLSVSLLVAYFLIPSLIDVFRLKPIRTAKSIRRKRRVVLFNAKYLAIIRFIKRFRLAFVFLFILGFGIPVHWLPNNIEKDNFWAGVYNKSLGASAFTNSIKPVLEKVMGGSLRLFSENVFESSYYQDPERTQLYIRGKMPEGCTVKQMNDAIKMMEQFLAKYPEIEMYETRVNSYRNSSIVITFKPAHEFGSFPHYLKNELISRAIEIGGVDSWSVYGVGKGFSNALYSGYKSNQITLEGYNYDQLYAYATILKDSLVQNRRVNDLEITGQVSWDNQVTDEFWLQFNPELLAINNLNMAGFFNELKLKTYESNISPVYDGSGLVPVTFIANTAQGFNTWQLKNAPVALNNTMNKLENMATFEKRPLGTDIYRNNQQYTLTVAWDFIGPYKLAEMVQNNYKEKIEQILPLGYKTKERNRGYWDKKDKKQYYLIGLVMLIIFFICSILLESLVQPLAIIALIPISFIGVFLTFFLFDFNFDQGGFASFILLAGITVNSALYIVNDYNQYLKTQFGSNRQKHYVKAYNHKIIPVLLTVLSTIFGLTPFIIGGQKEAFWFSFAVGTIGGLLFSLLAIFFYFPLFIKLGIKQNKQSQK